METRKILIANSNTSQRVELMSAATTLGELKAEMDAADIAYAGLDFTEGFTKTQLLSDDSLLPTNITHRNRQTGEETVTNDLVILLTNTKKKQSLGAEDRSRAEAYAVINGMDASIKDDIREEFGRNYTQVATADLWRFLDELNEGDEDYDEDDEEEEEENEITDTVVDVNDALKNALTSLGTAKEALTAAYSTVQNCINQLTALAPQTYQLGNTSISDKEINDMLASI